MKSLRKNKSVLLFLFVILFITNGLMFDFLSWENRWVPIAQIIVAILLIWVVVLYIKAAGMHPEIRTHIST